MSTLYDPRLHSSSVATSMVLTDEQEAAVKRLSEIPNAVMIAPTGAGKTAIILHHVERMKGVRKFIVAAPPTVVPNWPIEAEKWGLKLKVIALSGSAPKRRAFLEEHIDADVVVVSLGLFDWLSTTPQAKEFTGVVIDELSKACGKQTKRLKTKLLNYLTSRIGMTATPVAENFQKLYDMMRIIDQGETLGTRKERYLDTYFTATDFKGYNRVLRDGADSAIMALVKDKIVDVKYSKHDELPPKDEIELVFDMPKNTRKVYDKLRKDLVVDHSDEESTVAVNMAVLSSKMRQIASGFSISEKYDGIASSRGLVEYDMERALAALKWAIECEGERGLIIYEYDHQRVQLERVFKDYANVSAISMHGSTDNTKILTAFKQRKAQFLIAQQNTLSHGVDGLQKVCRHLLFYQPIWSADTVEQAIGRIWRQGQSKPVTVSYLVADDSVDDVVLNRVESKAENMKMFLKHLRK